jgi:hypothetical protein
LPHPDRFLRQGTDHAPIQAARRAVVDLLDAGVAAEFGGVQASRQGLILAPVPLLIDQHRQAVEEAQLAGGRVLLLRLQCVDHAV